MERADIAKLRVRSVANHQGGPNGAPALGSGDGVIVVEHIVVEHIVRCDGET